MPWDANRDELIAFVLRIGVVEPCDLSLRVMVATLIVAAGVNLHPMQAFQKLPEPKHSFHLRRKSSEAVSLDSFPNHVTLLTSVYADRYDPRNPPVRSPINVQSIDLWPQRDNAPAIKSNGLLRSDVLSPSASAQASSPRTPPNESSVIGVLTTPLDRATQQQQPPTEQPQQTPRIRSNNC